MFIFPEQMIYSTFYNSARNAYEIFLLLIQCKIYAIDYYQIHIERFNAQIAIKLCIA